MFKIAKLENVKNEKVSIDLISQQHCSYKDGQRDKEETFNTLSFDISGDNYSLGFDFKCRLEKILELPMNEIIDFNDYILDGETWLDVNGLNGIEPQIDIKITRYLKNNYIIYLKFYTEHSYDDNTYSGIIEFTFNLDDYL